MRALTLPITFVTIFLISLTSCMSPGSYYPKSKVENRTFQVPFSNNITVDVNITGIVPNSNNPIQFLGRLPACGNTTFNLVVPVRWQESGGGLAGPTQRSPAQADPALVEATANTNGKVAKSHQIPLRVGQPNYFSYSSVRIEVNHFHYGPFSSNYNPAIKPCDGSS